MNVNNKTILVTGGCGFIGSNFIKYMLNKHKSLKIINYDKLTYAGNTNNIKDIQSSRHLFIKGDICNRKITTNVIKPCDAVVHFAAETHVDRAIFESGSFAKTDVVGTQILLEAARNNNIELFVQISTDEVYGQISKGSFKESDALNPRNPYSASKAGAEMLAKAYNITHELPVIITRSSNNYGPHQHIEKFIPKIITNAIQDRKVPVYGKGEQVRDWLYVIDNCRAIELLMRKGKTGEIYNIATNNERKNIDIAALILEILSKPKTLIEFVADRKAHDFRYSLNCSKIKKLGWLPKYDFCDAMQNTVNWYIKNEKWWKELKK